MFWFCTEIQYPVKLALKKYVEQNKDFWFCKILEMLPPTNTSEEKEKDNPIKEITKPMNKRYKKMVKEITKC